MFRRLLLRLPPHIRNHVFIIYRAFSIIIKLILIDQAIKWWFISYLIQQPARLLRVTSFLDIVYVWNYGISFGIFKNYLQYSNIVFIVLNSIIILYLCYGLLKLKSVTSFWGYSFIIGGAIGNVIDRCYRGAVFDFICFHYQNNYWFPVFNLADSFIFIGVMLVLYDLYKTKKNIEEKEKQIYDDLAAKAEAIRNASDAKIDKNK
ncbi:Lipoprotein signal peptidase [Candidatus Trichorickettsia mobilis]|uniref:Lipoprotein signal peptidase n=1 Tax=Candidatus Trichorickettsia mobilis TaxID=1346319 RepID=A0ABZ0UY19_9RICK|nr:Lipoprotein signal peptidase [Candidatus Trichorickettsia mobilis]